MALAQLGKAVLQGARPPEDNSGSESPLYVSETAVSYSKPIVGNLPLPYNLSKKANYKAKPLTLACVAQLVGASSCKLKSHGFNSQSGHMP